VNRALKDVAFFQLNVDGLQASAQYSPSSLLYIRPDWALAVIYVTRPELIRTTEVMGLPFMLGSSSRRIRETGKRRADESEQKRSFWPDPPAIRSSLFKGTSGDNPYSSLC